MNEEIIAKLQKTVGETLEINKGLLEENKKLKERIEKIKSHVMEARYYLDQNDLDDQDKKNGMDFLDEALEQLNKE